MSGKLSIAVVALGLWLLTLMVACGLGAAPPTPTAAPATPTVVASPSPPPRPPASPSPSPSPIASGRYAINTMLVIADPDRNTSNAGVRLRTRAALGEDDGAVSLFDGDEVQVISAQSQSVSQASTGKVFIFWNVEVKKGNDASLNKRGWVAEDFVKPK